MPRPVTARPSVTPIDFQGIEAYHLQAASGASAIVSGYGAQVLSWVPPDGVERLFLSERAKFDGSAAIRGGVPVCFPQFSGLGSLPKHGLVRQRPWQIDSEQARDDYALLTLTTASDEASRTLWPHDFRAELTVVLEGQRLDIELGVDNTGPCEFAFTAALHTYLQVWEVEEITLQGLRGYEYRDAANHDEIRKERHSELVVDAEMDRVYHGVAQPLLLRDNGRSLGIHAESFPDVVVWNPWETHCATLPDMARLDFRHMLCVEAAVARAPVTLAAGASWWGRQTLVAL
ncbi:MAG: D-hexose-6-phosphate mutarotase [Proteobacteria bacterium]|nr:D-hexose-6-phosphate mutarotase [Pseudomonadota bacterium]HQR03130.1 D-hexose-6-phosphate mutarotase [Rhodocyclaceae bacterium]